MIFEFNLTAHDSDNGADNIGEGRRSMIELSVQYRSIHFDDASPIPDEIFQLNAIP